MKNKYMQRIILIIGCIFTLLLIVWLCLCKKYDDKFWYLTFAEWLPIFIGFIAVFFFSYFLANKKQAYDKKLETYETIIIKIQTKLREVPEKIFICLKSIHNINPDIYKKDFLIYFRSLRNYLDLIEKNNGDYNFRDEIDFIKKHLDDYKEEMTDNLDDYLSLKSKELYANREIDLIETKLDEIRLKLH